MLWGWKRIITIILAIVCVAMGIALVIMGDRISADIKEYKDLVGDKIKYGNWVTNAIIGIGGLVIVVSLLGFLGALLNNSHLLPTYATLLIILSIIQLGIAACAFYLPKSKYVENIEEPIEEHMWKVFPAYSLNRTVIDAHGGSADLIDVVRDMLHKFQKKHSCCGVYGPDDYKEISVEKVPGSCCGKPDDEVCDELDIYKQGCPKKFVSDVKSYIRKFGVVLVPFGITEIVAAIFACWATKCRPCRRSHRAVVSEAPAARTDPT